MGVVRMGEDELIGKLCTLNFSYYSSTLAMWEEENAELKFPWNFKISQEKILQKLLIENVQKLRLSSGPSCSFR